jgi:hypothetical protein
MLVTERFVFLHVPKTGGSFVQDVLLRHLPAVDLGEALRRRHPDQRLTHAPHGDLADRWRQLPAAWVVRNPWDWYVSFFSYQVLRAPRRKRPMDASWEFAFLRGETTFKEVVTALCTEGQDQALMLGTPDKDLDLYSAFVRAIVGSDVDLPNVTALRFERLRKQLIRFLERHVEVTPQLRRAIRRAPAKKQSTHRPYAEYYDSELAELVGERTRWLCERFGYAFGGQSERRASARETA